MTQNKLAKALGFTPAYISAVLNGKKSISEDTYNKIAEISPELKDKFTVKIVRYKVSK